MPRRTDTQDVIDAVIVEYGLEETGNPAAPYRATSENAYQITGRVRGPSERNISVPSGNEVWLPTAVNTWRHAGRIVTDETQFKQASYAFAAALSGQLIDGESLREQSNPNSPKYMREADPHKIYLVFPVARAFTGLNMQAFNRANGTSVQNPVQNIPSLRADPAIREALQNPVNPAFIRSPGSQGPAASLPGQSQQSYSQPTAHTQGQRSPSPGRR
ncbi:hypothetical protein [Streptomyces mirabilis]|uniref:hypothetical protein n=1 Tax=Streptomyces mirabilis TaxID=68239 RepID=UPI0033CC0AF8